MVIEFLPTQWKDGKTGNTPITAAQLNRIEKVADELVKTVNAETVKIENKVDKVKGKELSTNDFTNEDKQAVGKIAKKTDKTYVDNNFANAIKQVVSGDVISVSDVSPIKHIIGCKVSGTSNPTAVKVIRCNKNLAEKQPGIITSKTAESVLNFKKNVTFPKITISFDLKNFTSSNIGSAFWLIYKADGSPVEAKFIPAMKTFGIELNATPINKHISYSFENMIFSEIKMSYYGGLTGSIENLQIEIGDETSFTVIDRTEYTPTADGTVEGMTSLSPNMTILTDNAGAIVNAEYNADTKKYIEDNGGGGGGKANWTKISEIVSPKSNVLNFDLPEDTKNFLVKCTATEAEITQRVFKLNGAKLGEWDSTRGTVTSIGELVADDFWMITDYGKSTIWLQPKCTFDYNFANNKPINKLTYQFLPVPSTGNHIKVEVFVR